MFLHFFIFKKFFSQNRINGCDCCGPDGRLDTKIDQIDLRHISMTYASFVIIWHFMSYDAYDIEIWHKSILTILVSKEASGPQQSHLCIRFWLNNYFKIRKMKIRFGIFFLYKFWESFVFLAQKYCSRGSTSPYLSEMNLMFLESVDHREWE